MTTRIPTRTLAAAIGLATAGALMVAAPSSTAAGKARTVVTIKADGTDLSGTVKSKRKACKDGRKVYLYLQRGARGGGNDELFATDTTELDDGVGEWETGNLGFEGKFYATVKRTPKCKAAASRTVVAERDDD